MSVNNNFKDYFNGIKNELNNKDTRKDTKEYYRNAIKDLTQPQREHLMQILKGDLDPASDDAKDIMNSLTKYKEAYDAAPDKTAYITVRNPPREKSWFKSIARALSNWGSRISSEKVFKALDKTEEIGNLAASKWLSQFEKSYFSYSEADAVRGLDKRILTPSETRFRGGEEIQLTRKTSRLTYLTSEEMTSLSNAIFSDADHARLLEIKGSPDFEKAKAKYKQFKQNFVKPEDGKAKINDLINQYRSVPLETVTADDPHVQLYIEYTALNRKQDGLKGLFMLKDKETGERTLKIDQKTMDSIDPVLKQLAEAHHCTESEILIAYDQGRPLSRMDSYLGNKLEAGKYSKSDLNAIREAALKGKELEQELKLQGFTHQWHGDISILFGGPQMELRRNLSGELHTSVDLDSAENLLIVGPKAKLEPYKAQYGDKIVYLEDLSTAQKDALNVPMRLYQ